MSAHPYMQTLQLPDTPPIDVVDFNRLDSASRDTVSRLPMTLRILLENLLRHLDREPVCETHIEALLSWSPDHLPAIEIPFFPSRVLMQDFTGVPAVVDLAALRDAVRLDGGDPSVVNPAIPIDLVIDHSVQVDCWGTPGCLGENLRLEYERNAERYCILKWAANSFKQFRVVPPGAGICHQVNLEHLAQVVRCEPYPGGQRAVLDSVLGTDSHTPMVNGIGVLGWGVGGIEAESVAMGLPYMLPIPAVVGVRLSGRLPSHATATDLVLTITERLRALGVVGQFVEYFGPGVASLSVPDRATIANMTPEHGATVGLFPIDGATIDYLRLTGRREAAARTEFFTRFWGLFDTAEQDIAYSRVLEVVLDDVTPCIAGPSRPQDRIPLERVSHLDFGSSVSAKQAREIILDGAPKLQNGNVVIAALTSCTNTSNPDVMVAAGILARNALQRGLCVPAFVKTSFAPGSRVVVDYLDAAGLLTPLERLGFAAVAFGCTTCIGNSGPLIRSVEDALQGQDLHVASVLSGNRNFPARIHPLVRSNFLASPPLVVAFALAGRIDIDFQTEPLGRTAEEEDVFLRDIWPERDEIRETVSAALKTHFFAEQYAAILAGDPTWEGLSGGTGLAFPWRADSTYIQDPPFLRPAPGTAAAGDTLCITGARALLVLGDSVTTDHISPAGAIAVDSPAGHYLQESCGVSPSDFNSYGARRGNHQIMMRGTFANVRLRNRLVSPREGGYTLKLPEGDVMPVFAAAQAYLREETPLIVLAGSEYGTGSSRDWAAKGTALLGIRAVIAKSFERIHRNNLLGMGVLPLQFREGDGIEELQLTGRERFTLRGPDALRPRASVTVTALADGRPPLEFTVRLRLDTQSECDVFLAGGILPYVLEKLG